MPQPRYLTKSRYKLALECPRKLFYTGKKEYANNKSENFFLLALADGGFQVGELAKQYFSDGVEITVSNKEEALKQTLQLLQQQNVTIFEAAIRHEELYVLVDVLKKRGKYIELIEVKSKTWNSGCDVREEMLLKRNPNKGLPNKKWAPYVNDVAFQHYVLSRALPDCTIHPYLMMVNKNAVAPENGLNQKFRIVRDGDARVSVSVAADLDDKDLEPSILTKVPVSEIVNIIQSHYLGPGEFDLNFEGEVRRFMQAYTDGERLTTSPCSKCKACEFRCNDEQRQSGLQDGFRECWSEMLGWQEADFQQDSVLDIWNCTKANSLLKEGKVSILDVTPEDIAPKTLKENNSTRLTRFERQSMQIQLAQDPSVGDYIETTGFQEEMQTWRYPFHFIDFETSSEALPFFKGSRPNDPIIFQYSHHVMYKDGSIEHIGQCLVTTPGVYPSFELLRQLKQELEQDQGTIFRYHNHENTCLAKLFEMLKRHADLVPDTGDLMGFIKFITHSTNSSSESWVGDRDMVDLCKVCEWYYLPISAKGRSSLKVILPAILNGSNFLQDKYSKPIYGGPKYTGGIPSLNFENTPKVWVQFEGNQVIDPYKLLPPVFEDFNEEELESIEPSDIDNEIAEGGAAMVAFRRLQLTDVSDIERNAIENSLLKYCELDTLAMVMLVEGWANHV